MVHVVVLVLGDVGRSPRMQYQACSLASMQEVSKVTLIGYDGEKCIDEVVQQSKINLLRFSVAGFEFLRNIPLMHAIFRALAMVYALVVALGSVFPYDIILIQNPPCLPALVVAYLMQLCGYATGLRPNMKIMLDWHNLGFKMFEEKHGPKHVLVRMSKNLEKCLSKLAVGNTCVSETMRLWLKDNFSVDAAVVYDKPAAIFHRNRPSIEMVHELFIKLGFTDDKLFSFMKSPCVPSRESTSIQIAMDDASHVVSWRKADFCPLIISSTSWTPDEDFDLFLGALVLLNQKLQDAATADSGASMDRVLVAITGKGPMKAQFMQQVTALENNGQLTRVCIRSVWLEPQDYPLLMGCANLGVCLHTSSSGIDLPMKVLDMFGSGVAVCAARFDALHELVQDGQNGRVFTNKEELFEQMYTLLFAEKHSRPSALSCTETDLAPKNWAWETQELRTLRTRAAKIESWSANWERCMKPVVLRVINKRKSWLTVDSAIVMCIYAVLAAGVYLFSSR